MEKYQKNAWGDDDVFLIDGNQYLFLTKGNGEKLLEHRQLWRLGGTSEEEQYLLGDAQKREKERKKDIAALLAKDSLQRELRQTLGEIMSPNRPSYYQPTYWVDGEDSWVSYRMRSGAIFWLFLPSSTGKMPEYIEHWKRVVMLSLPLD